MCMLSSHHSRMAVQYVEHFLHVVAHGHKAFHGDKLMALIIQNKQKM